MRGLSGVLAATFLAAPSPGFAGSWASSGSLPSQRRAWSSGLALGHDQMRGDLVPPIRLTGPTLGLEGGACGKNRSSALVSPIFAAGWLR